MAKDTHNLVYEFHNSKGHMKIKNFSDGKPKKASTPTLTVK